MRARIHTQKRERERERSEGEVARSSKWPSSYDVEHIMSEAGRWQRAPTKETFREFGLLYLGNRLIDSAKKLTNEKF